MILIREHYFKRYFVKFIRKNGRIIPIREKGDEAKIAGVSAGSYVAYKGATKDSILAKTFKGNTYKFPMGMSVQTVSNEKRYLPRAFAVTRNNSVGGKRIMFASTLFEKERAGWGKKLFSAVQFNAIKEGKTNISGSIISTKALRFTKKENSKYFLDGKKLDYISAKKVIRKGYTPSAISLINPKNRSYIGLGLKGAKSTNKLAVAIGSTVAIGSLYSLLKKDKK